VLLVGAAIAAAAWLALDQIGTARSFSAPGQIVFHASTTDPVTIWHEVQVAGRGPVPPDFLRPPAGLTIRVKDQATGRGVSLDAAPKFEQRINSTTRLSIYQFTPDAPGDFAVSASGPSCTLAVGGSNPAKAGGGVLLGLCGGCGGVAVFVLGVVMLIVTGVRHSGSKTTATRVRPPPL
jgi:hypothetical protein